MKVHFTIEFPTRSGEPVEYETDVDVLHPKVTMQPEYPGAGPETQVHTQAPSQEAPEHETEAAPAPAESQMNENEFKEFRARLERGEIDKEELQSTIDRYRAKNLEMVEQVHSANMEVAKMKAMMKKAPDEQIEELIAENERLRRELKEKLQEQREENQEDSQYLREEIKELREKLKEKDARIEKMVEEGRSGADSVIKFRTQAEALEIELREQKAKMEEKYKHFEELNKYISDLLHEKKKLNLEMEDKQGQWKQMKEELEGLKKGQEEDKRQIENQVTQKSLEDNQKRWDEFQDKIADRERKVELLQKQLKLADEAMRKEGDEVKLMREAGANILLRIEELEDICEIMSIEFDRTDVDALRKRAKELAPEQFAREMQAHLKIIAERQQNIYNHIRG